jgi:D-arabinose 1-dehydrogenase-like Zn-dependent alcohol dehydrogenase
MQERNLEFHVRKDAGDGSNKAWSNRGHPLNLMSIDKPTMRGNTGLLLEIEACGVCRSNLHLIEGD